MFGCRKPKYNLSFYPCRSGAPPVGAPTVNRLYPYLSNLAYRRLLSRQSKLLCRYPMPACPLWQDSGPSPARLAIWCMIKKRFARPASIWSSLPLRGGRKTWSQRLNSILTLMQLSMLLYKHPAPPQEEKVFHPVQIVRHGPQFARIIRHIDGIAFGNRHDLWAKISFAVRIRPSSTNSLCTCG